MIKKTAYMHPEDVPIPHTMRDIYPGDAFFGDPKADEMRKNHRKDEGGYETTPDKGGTNWEKPEGAEEAPARERYELDKEPKRATRDYAGLLVPKIAADPERVMPPAGLAEVVKAALTLPRDPSGIEGWIEEVSGSAGIPGTDQWLMRAFQDNSSVSPKNSKDTRSLRKGMLESLLRGFERGYSSGITEYFTPDVMPDLFDDHGGDSGSLTEARKIKTAADTENPPQVPSSPAPAPGGRPLPEALQEWKKLSSEMEGLKQALAKLDKQQRGLFDEIGPQMNALEEKTAIIDNLVFKYTEYTSTSVSYSNLWEAALKKVNAATAKVLSELQKELTKPTAPVRKMKVTEQTPPKTSRLVFAGIVDTIKGWFDKLLGTLDTAIDELSAVGEDVAGEAMTAAKTAARRPADTLGDDPEWLDDLLPGHLQKRAALPSGATSPASSIGSPTSTGGTGDMSGGYKPGDAVSDPTGRAGTVKEMTPDGKMNVEFRDTTGGPQSAVYDPKSTSIKRAAVPPPWVLQVMSDYFGEGKPVTAEDMDFEPDPRMAGVWAARLKGGPEDGVSSEENDIAGGFLITGKNPDTDVEEVEFKTWPPKPRTAATPGPSGREMDPAARPLARAPAGMETDDQTGAIKMSPVDTELPDLRVPGKMAIVFPNLERKHYSVRPYFVHNWLSDVKLACKRAGFKLEGDSNAEYLTIHVASRADARKVVLKLVKQFNLRPEQLRLASRVKTAVKKTAKQYRQASDAEELWLEKFADEMGNQTDTPMSSSPADAQTEPLPEDMEPAADEEAGLVPGDAVEVQSEDGETFTGTVTTKVEEGYLIEKDGQPGSEVEAPAEQVTAIRKTSVPLTALLDCSLIEELDTLTLKHAQNGYKATLLRTAGGPKGTVQVALPNGERRWMPANEFVHEGRTGAKRTFNDEDWLDERSLRGPHNPGLGLKY